MAGTSLRREDIHRWTWYSNDRVTKKDVDHILLSARWKAIVNCKLYRAFEFNSDQRPVVATLRFHQKCQKRRNARGGRYDECRLEQPAIRLEYQRRSKGVFAEDDDGGVASRVVTDVERQWQSWKGNVNKVARTGIATVQNIGGYAI